MHETPREIVDRQLRAYNARDVEGYCALFAPDAVLSMLNLNENSVRGIAAIRVRYTERFRNPKLRCDVRARIELGDFVIDHEHVVGLGNGPLDAIAIYEVRNSLICSVNFIWQSAHNFQNL